MHDGNVTFSQMNTICAAGTGSFLQEQNIHSKAFRGIGIYREEIALETETCTLCTNNCCISLTTVSGETVAYGFMCGRDYEEINKGDTDQAMTEMVKILENAFLGNESKVKPKHRRSRRRGYYNALCRFYQNVT